MGLLIDTGLSHRSTGELGEFRAYCTYTGARCTLNTSTKTRCNFGVGLAVSLGLATIDFPFGDGWLCLKMHIIDDSHPRPPLPMLLSLGRHG